jgi:uncharacterized protein DUF547
MFKVGVRVLAVVLASVALAGQESKGYDDILDTYVRDGEVYYRALKSDRSKLDAYVNRIAAASPDALPRAGQVAFWINAYNALVLRTIIDHYPIQRRSNAYPAKSIRQIPGAFERLTHRVAGRTLTLDQIEQTVLSGFGDPRVYLALGRGTEGGGRLRSEVFTDEKLEAQLTEAATECFTRQRCARIDPAANRIVVSPIFSWREKEFAAAYADKAPGAFADRSPIERAVLAFIQPKLLTNEREFVEKNAFKVEFGQFDWQLNDLTGRGGR